MAKIQIFARLRPTNNRYEGLQTTPTDFTVQIGDIVVGSGHHSKPPSSKYSFKFSNIFEENSSQSEIFEAVSRRMVDRFVEGYNGTVFAYGQTSTGKTYTIEGSARRYEERGLIPRTLSYLYGILEKRKGCRNQEQTATSNVQDGRKGGGGGGGESGRGGVASEGGGKDGGGRTERGIEERKEAGDEEKEEEVVKVHISYMEIYQDTGYDLLNPGTRPGSLMLTLPKVQVREGPGGMVVVRDLSVHEAATEQVALSLLFQGSTCRKVAETAMNQSSSRSHSIFTISLTLQQPGSEVILNSKLHLVDLAGSERVSRMGLDGRLLQEAKYINLSLHHLEHVIVALHQQRRNSMGRSSRGHTSGIHIPYRNSMLTMVLKDSLGGNCLTSMIATVSAEVGNIWETISTLRFSQRVACIANNVRRNEELDDKAVIKKLKRRVVELERELTLVKYNGITPSLQPMIASDSESSEAVTEADRKLCHRILYEFFHGRIENPVEAGIKTRAMFHECLLVLRNIVLQSLPTSSSSSSLINSLPATSSSSSSAFINSSPLTTSFPTSSSAASTTRGSPSAVPATSSPLTPRYSTPLTLEGANMRKGYTGEENHRYCSQKATKKEKKKKKTQKTQWNENTEQNEKIVISSSTSSRPTPSQFTPHPLIQSPGPAHINFIHDNTNSVQSTSTVNSRLSSSGLGSVENEEVSFQSTLQKKERKREEERKPLERGRIEGENVKERSERGLHVVERRGESGRDGVGDGKQWAQRTRNPNFSTSPSHLFMPSNRTAPSTTLHSRDPTEHQLHNDPRVNRFSPEQSALKQLEVQTGRLEKSKNEKAKLLNGVHLLSLRVEEEDLRNQLNTIAEHLASQHAHVLQLQQSSGVQAGTESDQLCAENIAEQQLRMKQAKFHQRFLNIQQQINNRLTSPSKEEAQTIRNPNSSPIPLRSSVAQVVNATSKTEVQNSKVQQEIERLRISQAEKDLELKEAITRRKLWDLKQQLLQSGTSSKYYQGTLSPNKISTFVTTTAMTNDTSVTTDAISSATANTYVATAIAANTITAATSSRPTESGGLLKQSCIHYTASAKLDPSISVYSDSSSYCLTSKVCSQCSVQPCVYHSSLVDKHQTNIGRAHHTAPQLLKHSPPQNIQHMIRSSKTPEKSNIPHNSSDKGKTYNKDNEDNDKVEELCTALKAQSAVETLLQRKSLVPSPTKKHNERAGEVPSSSTTFTTSISIPFSSALIHNEISNSESQTVSDISENTQTHQNELIQLTPTKRTFKSHSHPLQYSPLTTKSMTTNCISRNNKHISYVAKNVEFLPPSNVSVPIKPSLNQCDTPENGLQSALFVKDLLSSSEFKNSTLQSEKHWKPRLAIPKEGRETEYMTAVQRQRDRVSRIRHCIAAATLIQRTWREYRKKKT